MMGARPAALIHGVSNTLPDGFDALCIKYVAALKAARHALGWSQQDMAQRSGISRVTIARLETGKYWPKASTIDTLLDAVRQAGVRLELERLDGGFLMEVEAQALVPQFRESLEQKPCDEPMGQELGEQKALEGGTSTGPTSHHSPAATD